MQNVLRQAPELHFARVQYIPGLLNEAIPGLEERNKLSRPVSCEDPDHSRPK